MAGHSRPKDGVCSLAYVPAIHAFAAALIFKAWMPGTRPGMTRGCFCASGTNSSFALGLAPSPCLPQGEGFLRSAH
jgi:hypothetical protein